VRAIGDLPATAFAGKIIVDANNYYPAGPAGTSWRDTWQQPTWPPRRRWTSHPAARLRGRGHRRPRQRVAAPAAGHPSLWHGPAQGARMGGAGSLAGASSSGTCFAPRAAADVDRAGHESQRARGVPAHGRGHRRQQHRHQAPGTVMLVLIGVYLGALRPGRRKATW